MKLRTQFSVTIGLAFGSLGILLVMGRIRLSEAVADSARIVEQQFNPLVLERAPSLQQTHEGLASLLDAMRAGHEARISQLQSYSLENAEQILGLAEKASESLARMEATLATATPRMPAPLRARWETQRPVVQTWIQEERAIIDLSSSLAQALNQRHQLRKASEESFAPFRESLDGLGEAIDELLAGDADRDSLARLGQAVSLVLNADRDAYQALVAERRIASGVESDPDRYNLLRQEFLANTQQIGDRITQAQALLASHEFLDFPRVFAPYGEWLRHSQETVALTDQILEQLRSRAGRIDASQRYYQESQLALAAIEAELKQLASDELATFEGARVEAARASERIRSRAASYLSLFNALTVVAGLALALLLLFQRRLVRKLIALSDYLARLDEDRLEVPYAMPRQRLFPSLELSALEKHLNAMRERLVYIIHAHRATLRSLSKSEARYSSLFYNSVSPIVVANPADGQIVDANEAAAQLYQLDLATLRAANLGALDEPDSGGGLARRLHGLDERRSIVCTVKQRRRDETGFTAKVYAGLVSDDGERRAILVIHDISQRVEFERKLIRAKQGAEAANRAKDDFLSVMSHELRTPLNPIIGYAQLLQQRGCDDTVRQYATAIDQSARRMLKLVESILDFTQLSQDGLYIESETFTLADFLEEAQALAQLQEPGRIVIRNGLAPELAPFPEGVSVCGAKSALAQMLMNLLGNALKYAGGASVQIVVGLVPESNRPSQKTLRVEVRDEGPGVPPSFEPSLFEPFTQADSTYTRSHQGIGLGLAICKRIAQRLGGGIGYRRNEPRGAMFWFAAPVSLAGAGNEPALVDDPYAAELRALKPRILVVEDNEENAAYLAAALNQFGAHASYASDGLAAIELAQDAVFDVALIDISMRGMDGFETLRRLQAIDAFAESAIAIAVTAHAQPSMRQTCFDRGFDDYLTKPVSPRDLGRALRRHLVSQA